MEKQIKALFFDFDGVLQDSEQLHFEAWIDALKNLGIQSFPPLSVNDTVGKSDLDVSERFLHTFKLSLSLEELYEKKLASYRKMMEGKIFNTDEEEKVLNQFSKNFYLAIVSSSHSDDIEYFLRRQNLHHYFSLIVAANHIFPHKPDPAPYLFALRQSGFTKEEVIAIEDSDTGLTSCKGASIQAIWMNRHGDTPSQLQSEFMACRSFSDLLLITD